MFRFAFTSVLLISCLGLQAQPNYLASYFQAKGALVQKHYAEAISLLDSAIALKLPEMDAMQLKGDVGLASGDLKNAEACYLRQQPWSYRSYFQPNPPPQFRRLHQG